MPAVLFLSVVAAGAYVASVYQFWLRVLPCWSCQTATDCLLWVWLPDETQHERTGDAAPDRPAKRLLQNSSLFVGVVVVRSSTSPTMPGLSQPARMATLTQSQHWRGCPRLFYDFRACAARETSLDHRGVGISKVAFSTITLASDGQIPSSRSKVSTMAGQAPLRRIKPPSARLVNRCALHGKLAIIVSRFWSECWCLCFVCAQPSCRQTVPRLV